MDTTQERQEAKALAAQRRREKLSSQLNKSGSYQFPNNK
jgi:hypothetical protein